MGEHDPEPDPEPGPEPGPEREGGAAGERPAAGPARAVQFAFRAPGLAVQGEGDRGLVVVPDGAGHRVIFAAGGTEVVAQMAAVVIGLAIELGMGARAAELYELAMARGALAELVLEPGADGAPVGAGYFRIRETTDDGT